MGLNDYNQSRKIKKLDLSNKNDDLKMWGIISTRINQLKIELQTALEKVEKIDSTNYKEIVMKDLENFVYLIDQQTNKPFFRKKKFRRGLLGSFLIILGVVITKLTEFIMTFLLYGGK